MNQKNLRKGWLALAALGIIGLLLCGGAYASIVIWPSVGAKGAEVLRNLAGDEFVARLEGLTFQVQDAVKRLQYRETGGQPEAPWAVSADTAPAVALAPTRLPSSPSPSPAPTRTQPGASATAEATPEVIPAVSPTLAPTATVEPVWQPGALPPLGKMEGEGQWSPYIANASSLNVAYRTFLQPDPERPYAVVAIVAFDLQKTRLHYVLGIDEPTSDVKVDRPGIIAPEDKKPGIRLAVFNGGFKGRHGRYGVMVNGVEVIPPRDGLGTLAIDLDGGVRIGAWNKDILPGPEILAWRQNGPLLVENGQVNPKTKENSTLDWGSTVDGEGVVPTWRSAVGISADGRTLYYAAGPYLTIPALAYAIQDAGANAAIQLDINNYWVHFGAIQFNGDQPSTQPLFPQMNDNINRYLMPYTRDFFYVTSR